MNKICLMLIVSLVFLKTSFSQEESTPTPEQYRAGIAKSIADLNIKPTSVWKVKNILIQGKRDSIPLRIYYPKNEEPLPILYYIHGGCWVAGDLETHDNICRYLCNQVGCIVIAIDYRQPPEDKYPAAVNDCYTALNWIYNNAKDIGGDKSKIGIIGDSSGGNLASAVCLKNRDEGDIVPIQIHVLINPVLDLRENSSSYNAYMGCVFAYLNNMEESQTILASPLAANSFNRLPEALILTSESDESKNEAKQYHNRLLNDDVESRLFEIRGIGHFAGLWAGCSNEVNEAKEIVVKELKEIFK